MPRGPKSERARPNARAGARASRGSQPGVGGYASALVDPELRRRAIFFAVLAALLLTAWGARTALGLEWNADSVRSVVV